MQLVCLHRGPTWQIPGFSTPRASRVIRTVCFGPGGPHVRDQELKGVDQSIPSLADTGTHLLEGNVLACLPKRMAVAEELLDL